MPARHVTSLPLTRASTLHREGSLTSITISQSCHLYINNKPKTNLTTRTILIPCRSHSKMSNPDGDSSPKIQVETPPVAAASAPREPASGGIGGILRRWKREDLLKRGSLALRGLALLFSLISFVIVASNKHGDWRDFDKYEEYRYLLAIAILSCLYTGAQAFRQIQELSTSKRLLQPRMAAMVDFFGDQIMAYLLISSASSAIPMTNRMREGADNIFTDSSASAISMSIFSFFCLAGSALISGYKLSTQPYI